MTFLPFYAICATDSLERLKKESVQFDMTDSGLYRGKSYMKTTMKICLEPVAQTQTRSTYCGVSTSNILYVV